jgi:AcrR family transcriptional regulator
MEVSTTESKSDNKRKLIRQAASECFARYGYGKTTLDDIGRTVRLNKASLYYYYKSKDQLFMEVVLEESTAFMAQLQERVATAQTPTDQIVTYLTERLRYYKHVLNLHSLTVDDLQTLEPRFEELYAGVRQQEVQFLNTLVSRLTSLPTNSTDLAELLLDVADGLKHQFIRNSGRQFTNELDYSTVETKTEHAIRFMLKGLTTEK